MSSDQRVEQAWETPTHEQIVAITKGHVAALESTDDDGPWNVAGMAHIMIRTVGRRSGNEHKVALPTWTGPDGHRIVVASFAGYEQHPAWYLNLCDRTANPEVYCRVQGAAFWSVPEVLDDDEHARIWALLTADRAWYLDYQAKTDRRIPLVRMTATRPA